jgi:hypothetical protein
MLYHCERRFESTIIHLAIPYQKCLPDHINNALEESVPLEMPRGGALPVFVDASLAMALLSSPIRKTHVPTEGSLWVMVATPSK